MFRLGVRRSTAFVHTMDSPPWIANGPPGLILPAAFCVQVQPP